MKTYTARYNDASMMSVAGSRFLRLGFLDSFLGYLNEKHVDKMSYAERLVGLLGKVDDTGIELTTIDGYFGDCVNLSECRTLVRAVLIKRLNLAGIKRCPAPTETIRLTTRQYLSGVFVINYFFLKALAAIMPKSDAIALFEEFMDVQTRTKYQLPHREKVSDLLYANSPAEEVFVGGHDYAEFELDAGQAGCKVTKCKWHEVLKEFNDPDLEYAVICHYDFEAARCNNSNFVLTREGTLAQGRSCCDFIWHDTRIDKAPVHPKQGFWDKIQVT